MLSLQCFTDGAFGTVIQVGNQLRYTPAADFYGSDLFTYTIVDDEGSTDEATVTVQVNAVDDAPTISNIVDQFTDEDVPHTVSFTISDLETAAESLIVTARSSNLDLLRNDAIAITGSGSTRTIAMQPAENQSGVATVTVTVRDAANATVESRVIFALIVGAINDAPIISGIPAQTLTAGSPVSIPFEISDVDSSEFHTVVTSSDSNVLPDHNVVVSGNGVNRTLTITPPTDITTSRNVDVLLTVRDEFNASTTQTFSVTINPIATNQAANLYAIELTADADATIYNSPEAQHRLRNSIHFQHLSLFNHSPSGYGFEHAVQFDLSGITDNIISATLQVTPSEVLGDGNGNAGVFAGDLQGQPTDWLVGVWLAQPNVPINFDVTSIAQSNPGLLSFWLAGADTWNGAKFYSRDAQNIESRPRLTLELEAIEPRPVATSPTSSSPLPSYQYLQPDGSIVTVTSSNPILLQNSGIVSKGGNRFNFYPKPGLSGSSIITATTRDVSGNTIGVHRSQLTVDENGMMTLTPVGPSSTPTAPRPVATTPSGTPIGWTPIAGPGAGTGTPPYAVGAIGDFHRWVENAPDEFISLWDVFEDDESEDDELAFSTTITGASGVVSTTIDDAIGYLTLDFKDATGDAEVTVKATDPDGEFIEVSFKVSVYAATNTYVEERYWGDGDDDWQTTDPVLWTHNEHRWSANINPNHQENVSRVDWVAIPWEQRDEFDPLDPFNPFGPATIFLSTDSTKPTIGEPEPGDYAIRAIVQIFEATLVTPAIRRAMLSASVEWEGVEQNDGETNFLPGAMNYLGGGWPFTKPGDVIFPERNNKQHFTDANDNLIDGIHNQINVHVTINPPMPEGMADTLFFRVYDPDHNLADSRDPNFDNPSEPLLRTIEPNDNVGGGFHTDHGNVGVLGVDNERGEVTFDEGDEEGAATLQITEPQPGNNWLSLIHDQEDVLGKVDLWTLDGVTPVVQLIDGSIIASVPDENYTPILYAARTL